jgi:hypothetical protein
VMAVMELMEKGDLKGYLRTLRPKVKDEVDASHHGIYDSLLVLCSE